MWDRAILTANWYARYGKMLRRWIIVLRHGRADYGLPDRGGGGRAPIGFTRGFGRLGARITQMNAVMSGGQCNSVV